MGEQWRNATPESPRENVCSANPCRPIGSVTKSLVGQHSTRETDLPTSGTSPRRTKNSPRLTLIERRQPIAQRTDTYRPSCCSEAVEQTSQMCDATKQCSTCVVQLCGMARQHTSGLSNARSRHIGSLLVSIASCPLECLPGSSSDQSVVSIPQNHSVSLRCVNFGHHVPRKCRRKLGHRKSLLHGLANVISKPSSHQQSLLL